MPTTTYCTDADIVAEWPTAVADLNGDVATFEPVRILVCADIESQLARRQTPIAPGDLTNTDELIKCEVYGVLAKLFLRASSTNDDFYAKQFKYYNEEYNSELRAPLSVADEVRKVSGGSIRVRRG
jgi:hypothetical protein